MLHFWLLVLVLAMSGDNVDRHVSPNYGFLAFYATEEECKSHMAEVQTYGQQLEGAVSGKTSCVEYDLPGTIDVSQE